MSETPAAGWYPDPQDATKQRYWDGNAWTEHTAPGAQPAAPSAPAGGGFAAAPMAGAGLGASAPDPWLWQSIVATLLCCLPAGVVGIVFAAKSQSAAKAGDLAGATKAAGTAKTWTLVSLGLGLLSVVVFVGFGLLGAASGY